jgi:dTDP-4-amino-4,6-dideoxygalactose transaminase
VTRAGASLIFCDIDPVTFNIDPEKLREIIKGLVKSKNGYQTKDGHAVKAVMPVHLFGQTAEMKPIIELSSDLGLLLVEDAAQAIGSTYHGKRAGSFGDVGCFSFFPSKNLGAFGDGGMVTTKDEAIRDKIMTLRDHGSKPKYYHKFVGMNSRLDAIQAAVLRVKLKHLDRWSEGRRENAEIYKKLFSESGLSSSGGPITPPSEVEGRYHIYNQFVIRAKDRDGLREYLAGSGIGTEIYYPVPLHLQECYMDLGYKKGDFVASEEAADTTLALPVYSELTEDMIKYVVEKIGEFYGG